MRHRQLLVKMKQQLSRQLLHQPTYLGSMLFDGQFIQANSNYACFMTFNMASVAAAKIPENFKVCSSCMAQFGCMASSHISVTLKLVIICFMAVDGDAQVCIVQPNFSGKPSYLPC